MIIAETDAQWTDCLLCVANNLPRRRWKWTHFRLCPNMHGIEGLAKESHELYNKIWNGDGNHGKEGVNTSSQEI